MGIVLLLIVVDMQNDFIDGALGTQEAVEILPNVKEKIKAREVINNYLVGIPLYIISKVSKQDRWIKDKALNEVGYNILPADFNYDSMTGLSYNDSKNKNAEIDDDDNIF